MSDLTNADALTDEADVGHVRTSLTDAQPKTHDLFCTTEGFSVRLAPKMAARAALILMPLALLLTGCGGSTYGDLIDLRDAAVDADYFCPAWESKDIDSGSCTDHDVFHLSASADANADSVAEHVDILRTFGFTPATMLVGDNWWIDGPTADLDHIADDLGGEIRVITAG